MTRTHNESFLDISKKWQKRLFEEQDTDEAIAIYKKEKKQGKLRVLKSLASLNQQGWSLLALLAG